MTGGQAHHLLDVLEQVMRAVPPSDAQDAGSPSDVLDAVAALYDGLLAGVLPAADHARGRSPLGFDTDGAPAGPLAPARSPFPVAAGFLGQQPVPERWHGLGKRWGLADVDLRLLLILVAMQVGPRFEEVVGYLHGDSASGHPSSALLAHLLTDRAEERIALMRRMTGDGFLVQAGLLRRAVDHGTSMAASEVVLSDGALAALLGEASLGSDVAPFARVDAGGDQVVAMVPDPGVDDAVVRLLRLARSRGSGESVPLAYLSGPPGRGRSTAARRFAAAVGAPLLVVDLAAALESRAELRSLARAVRREAGRYDAVVLVAGVDRCADSSVEGDTGWVQNLACIERPVLLSGSRARVPLLFGDVPTLSLPVPAPSVREKLWRVAGATVDDATGELAERFGLTPGAILAAGTRAARDAQVEGRTVTPSDLWRAARDGIAVDVGPVARHVVPERGWDHLVLPEDVVQLLHEALAWVRNARMVRSGWGFGAAGAGSAGVKLLLAGAPGTGKTLTAEVLAHDLGLDLVVIDLSGIVSKYIGETEKNLSQVFAAAARTDCVLFFDEADALFGKRTVVTDAHDRYANIEVSHLLQAVDGHDGVVVLATNLRRNIDEAFLRRMNFVVELPLPGPEDRRRIWRLSWPAGVPREADLDHDLLAEQFPLSGAAIRNASLAAAFRAADEHTAVGMRHVLHGVRRELQKSGAVLSEADLALLTGRRP